MERGTELSQTVATFIIQKILLDDLGLNYLCQTAERFLAVSTVLNNMVVLQIGDKPSQRLLKHIIKCYNRLTENPRAQLALGQNMPEIVTEKRLIDNLDENSKKCLKTLCEVLENQQQKVDISQQFDFQNIQQNKDSNIEFGSLGVGIGGSGNQLMGGMGVGLGVATTGVHSQNNQGAPGPYSGVDASQYIFGSGSGNYSQHLNQSNIGTQQNFQPSYSQFTPTM